MSTRRASRYDAAIVGGGPAGCATAIHLVRAGMRVCLIDPAAGMPRAQRPGFMELISPSAQQAAARSLRRPLVAEQGVAVCRSVVRWGGGAVGVTEHREERPLAFDRQQLARLLRDQARAEGCVLVPGRVRCDGPDLAAGNVQFTDGRKLFADVIVRAHGRRISGVGGRLALAAYAAPSARCDGATFVLDGAAEGTWGYVLPASGGGVFICLCVHAGAVLSGERPADALLRLVEGMELLRAFVRPDPFTRVMGRCYGPFADDIPVHAGNVRVGDAVHAQDPLSGRGLDLAFSSAAELAGALCAPDRPAAMAHYAHRCAAHIAVQEAMAVHFLGGERLAS